MRLARWRSTRRKGRDAASRRFGARGDLHGPRGRRLRCEPLEDRRLLAVYSVNSLLDTVAADGLITLREALEAANTNVPVHDAPAGSATETDTIRFDPALFTDGENPVARTLTLGGTQLTIADSLDLEGPGAELLSINANQLSRVFYVNSGVTASLEGLTITGGKLSDSFASGGGVYNLGTLTIARSTISGNWAIGFEGGGGGGVYNNSTLTIADSTLSDNVARDGGAIYMWSGTLIVAGSTISGNTAVLHGGGIRCVTSDTVLTVVNSTLSGNATTVTYPPNSGSGGGIASGGTLTISGSTITNNSTQRSGGGICSSGTLTISNSTISHNSAKTKDSMGGGIYHVGALAVVSSTISNNSVSGTSSAFGGGIWANSGPVTIVDSVVSGNSVIANHNACGGGIDINVGALTITNTIISDNSATGLPSTAGEVVCGGGIASGDTLVVTNSTISGNSAVATRSSASCYGGGIYNCSDGTSAVSDSTIAGNWATTSGGGIRVSDGAATITNSIIAANEAPTGANLHGTLASGSGYNLIDVDAGFLVTPGPGADGTWGTADDAWADLHLRADSPAVDAGSNTHAVDSQGNPLTTDVEGMPRIVGGTVDIGAHEYNPIRAVRDHYSDLAAGESHVLHVLANDSYPAGATVVVEIVTAPTWGTAVSNPDGTVSYTPYYGFKRNDVFTYRFVIDGQRYNVAQAALNSLGTSAVIPVSTAVDESDANYRPGSLSLREALTVAAELPGTNTITFDPSLGGKTISLQQGQLTLAGDVEIQGLGADQLTIDAHGQSRVFYVNSGVTATLDGLTITGGSDTQGGGICNDGGTLSITDSTISGNLATGTHHGYGGAIYNVGGLLTITDSTISGNSATGNPYGFGGGIYNTSGTLTITDSTISGNSVTGIYSGFGGGICNSSGTTTVTNSTFSGNSATSRGGGIYQEGGMVTVRDSTIAGNWGAKSGGGFYLPVGTATLVNSIVAANGAPSNPDLGGLLAPASAYNLIGTDPGFVVAPGPGADGMWGTADDVVGDLHLRVDSPAVNRGSNALAVDGAGLPLVRDLDGMPRVVYGTVDIGAYEFHLAADANLDAAVDDLDGSILAAHWQMPEGATWADADFNADGRVDDLDGSILAANWQAHYTPPAAAGGFAQSGDEGRGAGDEAQAAGSFAQTGDEESAPASDPRFIGPRLGSGGSGRRAILQSAPPSTAAAPTRAVACQSENPSPPAPLPASGARGDDRRSKDPSPPAPLPASEAIGGEDGQVKPLVGPIAWAYDLEHARRPARSARRLLARAEAVDLLLGIRAETT